MLLTHPVLPADPNGLTAEHETPLHFAAQHGHLTALIELLAHGADPNIMNCRDETPLDLGAQYGEEWNVTYLENRRFSRSLSRTAASSTNSDSCTQRASAATQSHFNANQPHGFASCESQRPPRRRRYAAGGRLQRQHSHAERECTSRGGTLRKGECREDAASRGN